MLKLMAKKIVLGSKSLLIWTYEVHYIISLQKLDEATSLLGPTCDTFIQTLDDCMKIIQSSLPFEGSHPHVTDAALPTSPLKKVPSRKVKFSLKIIRHSH